MSTDGGADLPADRPMTTVDSGPDRPDASAPDVLVVDASDTRVTTVDAQVDLPPPLLANGATCHLGTECQFGNCVDGFCCESACTGQCQSCGETTMPGKCVTIRDAVRGIVRAACPGSGTCASVCNGSDALACHYPASRKAVRAGELLGGRGQGGVDVQRVRRLHDRHRRDLHVESLRRHHPVLGWLQRRPALRRDSVLRADVEGVSCR